ncbi:MAG: hypothetical protein M3142_04715 [Bacteroidota bacterium]|nr:hypothetical protein [Bacteroidota bacterium]
MATVVNKALGEQTNNRSGRVRVLDSDTDFDEMNAGHIIPGADPPKNEHARGGFGDRDGRNGYGTDSPNGSTSLSLNEDTEDVNTHTDGLQTSEQLNRGQTIYALGDEDDVDDDDDFADVDTDDDDFDDDDMDISEIPDDDFDTDLDDDFDDDLDDDFEDDDDDDDRL